MIEGLVPKVGPINEVAGGRGALVYESPFMCRSRSSLSCTHASIPCTTIAEMRCTIQIVAEIVVMVVLVDLLLKQFRV